MPRSRLCFGRYISNLICVASGCQGVQRKKAEGVGGLHGNELMNLYWKAAGGVVNVAVGIAGFSANVHAFCYGQI